MVTSTTVLERRHSTTAQKVSRQLSACRKAAWQSAASRAIIAVPTYGKRLHLSAEDSTQCLPVRGRDVRLEQLGAERAGEREFNFYEEGP